MWCGCGCGCVCVLYLKKPKPTKSFFWNVSHYQQIFHLLVLFPSALFLLSVDSYKNGPMIASNPYLISEIVVEKNDPFFKYPSKHFCKLNLLSICLKLEYTLFLDLNSLCGKRQGSHWSRLNDSMETVKSNAKNDTRLWKAVGVTMEIRWEVDISRIFRDCVCVFL